LGDVMAITTISDIELQLRNILDTCKKFASISKLSDDEQYGFLVTIGSETGKISKLIKEI